MIENTTDFIIMLLGVALGICAMSFNWFGDSPAFLIAEGAYVGGGVAYGLFITLGVLETSVYRPLTLGDTVVLVPLLVGVLVFSRFTKFRWLARYPMAMLSGVGLGLTLGTSIDAEILTGIRVTVNNVLKPTSPINDVFVFVGLISGLTYFLYSARIGGIFHAKGSQMEKFMRFGRVVLMISFGYMYAQLLITEGLDFLISNVIIIFKRTLESIILFKPT